MIFSPNFFFPRTSGNCLTIYLWRQVISYGMRKPLAQDLQMEFWSSTPADHGGVFLGCWKQSSLAGAKVCCSRAVLFFYLIWKEPYISPSVLFEEGLLQPCLWWRFRVILSITTTVVSCSILDLVCRSTFSPFCVIVLILKWRTLICSAETHEHPPQPFQTTFKNC